MTPPRRRLRRRFFAVAEGLEDHFTWLTGARLQVFLVCLRATKFSPWWSGWSVREIAERAKVSRSTAHRALQELSRAAPVPPSGGVQGRRYLEIRWRRGERPNRLRVMNHIGPPTGGCG